MEFELSEQGSLMDQGLKIKNKLPAQVKFS